MLKYIQYLLVSVHLLFAVDLKTEAAKIYNPNNFILLLMGNRDSCATFLEKFEYVDYYEQTEELRASASNP